MNFLQKQNRSKRLLCFIKNVGLNFKCTQVGIRIFKGFPCGENYSFTGIKNLSKEDNRESVLLLKEKTDSIPAFYTYQTVQSSR